MFVEPLLDGLKNFFVLPARDPMLLARGALVLDGTSPANIGPVAVQGPSLFHVCIVVNQALAGRATIDIVFGQVDKVLLTNPTISVGDYRQVIGGSLPVKKFLSAKSSSMPQASGQTM